MEYSVVGSLRLLFDSLGLRVCFTLRRGDILGRD